ncbi:MAG: crossover junction endodeoxyribonuclease RuvC [Elusimicrobiota bacterium]
MRVLSVDPGLSETGWAVMVTESGIAETKIEGYGCIRTTSDEQLPQRLMRLYDGLNVIIQKFNPEVICVEKQFLHPSAASILATSQARGIILLACGINSKKMAEYNPREVKIAVTGNGSAGKEQVREMVKRILKLKTLKGPLDISDAMAVGICHINSYRIYNRVKG